MKVVFMGTPEFAVPTLERIVDAGHTVAAVYTQPDRPKGREQQLAISPVKEAAQRLGLSVHQPERIRKQEIIDQLASFHADVMVVVGYGQIIPQAIIDLPPKGILNVHASLLPKYRGAAPIQWAIANGELVTGVTTMRIDAGLDTGAVLLKAETPIAGGETAPELGARLSIIGAELLLQTLEKIDTITPQPQSDADATNAPILKKEDGLVDWNWSAQMIANRVRGFLPWPGAYTTFRQQRLHIWSAKADDKRLGVPGSLHIRDRSLLVACGAETDLQIDELQLEGRKRIGAAEFVNGQRLTADDILGEKTN